MWEYRATPINVVDGDTFDVVTDVGFGLDGLHMRIRLLGCDTWEDDGPTRDKGLAAAEFTRQWFLEHADGDGHVLIVTVKDRGNRDKHDSFGRYLAVVWSMDKSHNLGADLIAGGHTTGRYE